MADLYLHIGHNKTGSSYIQSSLACSVEALSAADIVYPIDEKRRISAGGGRVSNGNWLEFNTFLDAPDGSGVRYLFSSEMIYPILTPNHPLYNKFCDLFHNFDRVKILLLIRDPISHACSAYQQSIKRGGSASSLRKYIENYNSTKLTRKVIETIASFPSVDLTVINYSRKPNLTQVMEDWLQLEKGCLSLPPHGVVNRSLTRAELELQRQINIRIGGNAGHLFADIACNQLPHIKSDIVRPSIEEQEGLFQRLAPDIEFINNTIPKAERIEAERDIYLSPQQGNDLLSFSVEQLSLIAGDICDRNNKLHELTTKIASLKEKHLSLQEAKFSLAEKNTLLRDNNISFKARSKEKILQLLEVQSSLIAQKALLEKHNASLHEELESLKLKNKELEQRLSD